MAAGVNPAFALGTFHAESHSGTRGYAVVTHNWGNILYYAWEVPYGAVPYAPGNGYTYAMYPDWLSSVRAYADLLRRYHASGYTTVSSASAHWLGTIEGSSRHLTYLNNITAAMSILPDDAVPVVTALSVPASSRAPVGVSWSASDNLAVTGYELMTRLGSGAWSPAEAIGTASAPTTSMSRPLTLSTGTWTIAIRATDAAGTVALADGDGSGRRGGADHDRALGIVDDRPDGGRFVQRPLVGRRRPRRDRLPVAVAPQPRWVLVVDQIHHGPLGHAQAGTWHLVRGRPRP
jgi:hypothetical protein